MSNLEAPNSIEQQKSPVVPGGTVNSVVIGSGSSPAHTSSYRWVKIVLGIAIAVVVAVSVGMYVTFVLPYRPLKASLENIKNINSFSVDAKVSTLISYNGEELTASAQYKGDIVNARTDDYQEKGSFSLVMERSTEAGHLFQNFIFDMFASKKSHSVAIIHSPMVILRDMHGFDPMSLGGKDISVDPKAPHQFIDDIFSFFGANELLGGVSSFTREAGSIAKKPQREIKNSGVVSLAKNVAGGFQSGNFVKDLNVKQIKSRGSKDEKFYSFSFPKRLLDAYNNTTPEEHLESFSGEISIDSQTEHIKSIQTTAEFKRGATLYKVIIGATLKDVNKVQTLTAPQAKPLEIYLTENFAKGIEATSPYVEAIVSTDIDGDGLSNIDERMLYLTNMEKSDSHGDGKRDGVRVRDELFGLIQKNKGIYREKTAPEYLKLTPKRHSITEATELLVLLQYSPYRNIPYRVVMTVSEALKMRLSGKFVDSRNLLMREFEKLPVVEETGLARAVLDYHIGLSYHGQKDYKTALKHYTTARVLGLDTALLYKDIAAAYYGLGDKEKYVKTLEEALLRYPLYADPARSLADYYAEAGDFKKAISVLEASVKSNPSNAILLTSLGYYYGMDGNEERGQKLYEQAISKDFHSGLAHMNLANVYQDIALLKKEDNKNAVTEGVLAVMIDPNDSHFRNTLGYAYMNGKLYAPAENEFRIAMKLDPTYVRPYNNMGFLSVLRRDLPASVMWFRRAIDIDPKYVKALNNLGSILKDQGKFSEALPYLQRASALDPKWAPPFYNLGGVYEGLGNRQKAIENYQKAIDRGFFERAWVENKIRELKSY